MILSFRNGRANPLPGSMGLTIMLIMSFFLISFFGFSQDYYLEYATTGMGGAVSTVGAYSFVDLLKGCGLDGQRQNSVSYDVSILTGSEAPAISRINSWMLY